MSRGENLPAKNKRFPTQACTLVGLGPLEAALTRGGLRHGAADLGSWPSLWLACLCPISQCSGALVRRHGFWWARPLRAGFLRPWFWYGLFTVWLWERGVLWSVPTRPIRLSRRREAGLRRQAGCLRRHCSGLCSEASGSGSLESGLPSRVATRLVRGASPASGSRFSDAVQSVRLVKLAPLNAAGVVPLNTSHDTAPASARVLRARPSSIATDSAVYSGFAWRN
jgi:hypothetical protein